MKSRYEEVISVNAILATRYHTHSDLIRAAGRVATLNHHTLDNFTPEGTAAFATCRNCKAEAYVALGQVNQVTGSASDFTCEQVQAMRRKR